MRYRPGQPNKVAVTLHLGSAAHLDTITAAVLDARGEPFLSAAAAIEVALAVAARVVEVGELARFQAPPPVQTTGREDQTLAKSAEVAAFLARWAQMRA